MYAAGTPRTLSFPSKLTPFHPGTFTKVHRLTPRVSIMKNIMKKETLASHPNDLILFVPYVFLLFIPSFIHSFFFQLAKSKRAGYLVVCLSAIGVVFGDIGNSFLSLFVVLYGKRRRGSENGWKTWNGRWGKWGRVSGREGKGEGGDRSCAFGTRFSLCSFCISHSNTYFFCRNLSPLCVQVRIFP